MAVLCYSSYELSLKVCKKQHVPLWLLLGGKETPTEGRVWILPTPPPLIIWVTTPGEVTAASALNHHITLRVVEFPERVNSAQVRRLETGERHLLFWRDFTPFIAKFTVKLNIKQRESHILYGAEHCLMKFHELKASAPFKKRMKIKLLRH